MKYLILVGDGMGDYPLGELKGMTPLQAAPTPHMDSLARSGIIGLTNTIPASRQAGSDTANMAFMGINPADYVYGRGPMEAAAMNIALAADDIAFRCNLVYLLRQADGQVIMKDYAAGHITSGEAAQLVRALQERLGRLDLTFYPGVSFRHVTVWKKGPAQAATIPPHDYTEQMVNHILDDEGELKPIMEIIKSSWEVLSDHPVNKARVKVGKPPANSIWLWGQSAPPAFPTLRERYGLAGAVVTAVDLLRGIGRLTGLDIIDVPGATGYLDTNYAGKVEAALDALASGRDVVYVHVEAPDEASHSGSLELKLRAISDFDALVVGPLLAGLKKLGPHRILLGTDHFTPLSTRTHARDAVPFVLWDSAHPRSGAPGYGEQAATAGIYVPQAHLLLDRLIKS
jgi:2,3-bisphosphoglycerate-independent phosphoglycerate mutase